MEKLKDNDLKLLAYLYQHNREALTKIGKVLGLTREQVNYKLNYFQKEKIIKGFIPIISYSRLGYHNQILLFVKLSKPSLIKEFKEELKKSPNRIITVEFCSKYDLGFVLIFKDEKEKNNEIMKLLEKNKNKISDHHIIEPYQMRLYPLKFAGSKSEGDYLWIDYHKGQAEIDQKEKEILSILNKNARERIIEIAKKINISAELVIYKMKRLQKEGIFLGSRAIIDMQKLGHSYTLLQINMKNLSQSLSERIEKFAKSSLHIDTFYLSISKPNCYMQMFHKTQNELKDVVNKFKETFNEESFDLEVIPLLNEGEDINTLPFI